MTRQLTRSMPRRISIDDVLSLRRIVPEDAPAMFRIIQGDPEIGRNVTWPASVRDLEDARRGIEQLLSEDKSPYVLLENGKIIGFAGTWYPQGREHEVGFSYFLAKDSRGHGYITRAVRSLMQAVRTGMPVDTFVVNIIDGNDPSIAIAGRLGFKRTDEIMHDEALGADIRRYERPADD